MTVPDSSPAGPTALKLVGWALHTRALPGVVARRAFLGDLMRYWVIVDGREWIVDQPDPGAAAEFDGPVTIAVKPERVHVIAE